MEQFPLGEDEPVFLFRAKDKLVPRVLEFYAELCEYKGCNADHVDGILQAKKNFEAWQESNEAVLPGKE